MNVGGEKKFHFLAERNLCRSFLFPTTARNVAETKVMAGPHRKRVVFAGVVGVVVWAAVFVLLIQLFLSLSL
ncbi:MAG TPA: hypothetical protein VN668_20625 [Stellaceae bacterium]|nr:hypothetical protein [Stellaceae bacterium]